MIETVSAGFNSEGLSLTQSGEVRQRVGSVQSPTDISHTSDAIYASDRFGDVTTKRPSADNRDVDVLLFIDSRINWVCITQAGAWRRVIMNLFSNAMKYTHRGFIKVSLTAEHAPSINNEETSMITLIVEDSGRGISLRYLQDQLYRVCHHPKPLSKPYL